MKKGLLILAPLFMVLFLCSPALALDPVVKKNSVVSNLGLYGGQPEEIAVDYGTDVACVANYAPDGLYCTDDGGTTWQTTLDNVGVAKNVEIDQSNGYIYALVGDVLLQSTDSGVSFTDLTANVGAANFNRSIAINDAVMVAMSQGQVAMTEDDGATFAINTVASDKDVLNLGASPTAGTYYAVMQDDNGNYLYKTTDAGANWTDMDVHSNGVVADSEFYRVGVDPLDATHIVLTSVVSGNYNYQTLDGGTTWTALSRDSIEFNSGYVEFDGAGKMFTSNVYSSDNGTTWSDMETLTPASFMYFDMMAIDRDNPEILYANSSLGVAKSIDRGANWTDIVDGIQSVKTYDLAQSTNKKTVWAGCNGGLARTTNYNKANPTWTYPILPDQSISNWQAIWVQPGTANTVVAGGGTSIFRTTNGNDATPTWTQSTVPAMTGGGIMEIVADPDSNDTLYAVAYNDDLTGDDSGMVLTSVDNGIIWTNLEIPNDAPATSLTINSKGALYVGLTGDLTTLGVYKYSASGTWSKPSTDLDDYEVTSILVDPDDDNTLYATAQSETATKPGFYKSTDAGKNWTRITKGIKNVNFLDTLTSQDTSNGTTLYVAGQSNSTLNGVIYKSADGGENWDKYYTGLIQESFYTMLFDGLLWGNDRGLFEGKTRASLAASVTKYKVKQGNKSTFKVTLKDKVTGEKLANRNIKFYKKVGKNGTYKLYKTKKTNDNGVTKIKVAINKVTRFKAKWVPGGNSAEEFYKVTSKIRRVRLK